jgi:nucleoid-associated protein YgaU
MSQMELKDNIKVQKGDTLHEWLAFKIYGDYRKWKDLKAWNKNKVFGEGTVLKYYVPDQTFGWQPSGLPYLVKNGDTLRNYLYG